MSAAEPRMRVRQSETCADLYGALAKAQGAFTPVEKDRTADVKSEKGNFSYGYSTLASVLASTRPALSANGIALMQLPLVEEARVVVITRLGHSSGQWIEFELEAPLPRAGEGSKMPFIQALGSVISYLARYALTRALGVAAQDEDDDGSATEDPEARRTTTVPRKARREAPAEQPRAPEADPAIGALLAEFGKTIGDATSPEQVAEIVGAARKQLGKKAAPVIVAGAVRLAKIAPGLDVLDKLTGDVTALIERGDITREDARQHIGPAQAARRAELAKKNGTGAPAGA